MNEPPPDGKNVDMAGNPDPSPATAECLAGHSAGLGRRASSLLRSPYRAAAILVLVYATILIVVALPEGLSTTFGELPGHRAAVPVATGTSEIIEKFVGNDGAEYIQGAQEIAKTGWIQNKWRTNLWPIGVFLLRSPFLKLDPDGPIVLYLIITVCLTWAVFLAFFALFLTRHVPWWVAVALPLSLLPLTLMNTFLLQEGALGSDAQATALLAVGFLFIVWAHDDDRKLLAAIAAVALALAAYQRAQVSLFMSYLTVFTALLVVVHAYASRREILARPLSWQALSRESGSPGRREVAKAIRMLVITVLTFHLLCLPWRIYHLENDGYFDWINVDYTWSNYWRTKDEVAGIIYNGGGLAACHVEPEVCQRLRTVTKEERRNLIGENAYFDHTVRALLKHPVAWMEYKLPFVVSTWLQSRSNRPSLVLENTVIPLLGVLSVVLLLCSYKFQERDGTKLFVLGLIAVNISFHGALFTILHVQDRYFFQTKFLLVFCFLLSVALLFRRAGKPPPHGVG